MVVRATTILLLTALAANAEMIGVYDAKGKYTEHEVRIERNYILGRTELLMREGDGSLTSGEIYQSGQVAMYNARSHKYSFGYLMGDAKHAAIYIQ